MNLVAETESIERRRAEVELKHDRIRCLLDEQNLDGVVLTKHYNFSWMTAGGKNFVANCFDAGATTLLITSTERYAFCSVIEAPRIREEEQLEALGYHLEVFGWAENRTLEFIEKIADPQRLISDAPLGPIAASEALIAPLRRELTPDECNRYRYLGDAMSFALEEYLLTIQPGMSELEIAGGISNALWKYGIEQVMHLVTADDRSYNYRHGLPTANRLEKTLIVSINGRYKGLITTVSRMISLGAPPAEISNRYEACMEIETEAMRAVLPHAISADVCGALQTAYASHHYQEMFLRHGQGGCQGYVPREFSFTPHASEQINVDAAYCFNPVIDGAKTEDAFLLTQAGAEMITKPVLFDAVCQEVNCIALKRPKMMIL